MARKTSRFTQKAVRSLGMVYIVIEQMYCSLFDFIFKVFDISTGDWASLIKLFLNIVLYMSLVYGAKMDWTDSWKSFVKKDKQDKIFWF
jgi:hypothetical protein